MPHSRTFTTIILRTIDTGEADRFCILFTKEGGRKTARAKSVRKPKSRLGGMILPFRVLQMELTEHGGGSIVTSATDRQSELPATPGFAAFMRLQQASELLIALTEDDEPLPQIFDLLQQFLTLSHEKADPLPAFQLRLLYLLGLLPAGNETSRFRILPEAEKAYVDACTRIADLRMLRDLYPDGTPLALFVKTSVESQLNKPLKSMTI